jgi:glycolate oxidase FAD binding subunit
LTAPAEIVRASREAEVLEVVTWAAGGAKRLEVRGHGSKAAIGRPVAADAVLDLGALSGVTAYEPAELVLTARAGTPLAEIEALLAGHGQVLAFEPMDFGPLLGEAGGASIGGTIAANVSGPRRLKDGAARDHFLGFQAVSGRGEAFKAGGKVVKNVTGYDLSKLMAGSWGTLAVLTEVTLKVLPAPKTCATVAVLGLEAPDAARAMSRAVGSPADVSGAAHLPASIAARTGPPAAVGAAAVTALRLEGFGPSVAARIETLKVLLGAFGEVVVLDEPDSLSLWRFIRDVRAFSGDGRLVWRVSAPPMAGPAILAAIQAEIACEGFFDWAGGLLWLAHAERDEDGAAVRAACAAHAGQAMLVRAPADLRSTIEVFPPEAPPLAALTAKVKAGFDPLNILNPGRMRPEPAIGAG